MTPIHWPSEDLWETIAPLLPGFTVEIVPSIDSTNSELVRRARAGATEPILLVAEQQTAGRGRLGRDWHSDEANPGASLTFSLSLPYSPKDWSGLSLVVGSCIAQSLHPSLQLKWPNDMWWQKRKMAGILVETVAQNNKRFVVIGVGINICFQPTEILSTPAAALQELRPEMSATQTLTEIVPPLVNAVMQFEQKGFAPWQNSFNQRDALFGKNIICSNNVAGIAQGVDSSGALLVHTSDGVIKINSSEVSIKQT